MSVREFYVYVLFRPWDGSPFYVGKGKGRRWLTHDRPWHRTGNRRLSSIVKKARSLGLEIPKVKIRENLTESESFQIEVALIAAIGRGLDGPLANMTDGGEGIAGLNHSQESRAKMSALKKGRATGPRSPEHRAALSRALKGRIIKTEWRSKMSIAKKGKPSGPISPLRRAAIRKSLLAFWDSRRQSGLPLKHPRVV